METPGPYCDLALDPVGRTAFGLGADADGGDLSFIQKAGSWSLSRESKRIVAGGYVDLRGFYEAIYA